MTYRCPGLLQSDDAALLESSSSSRDVAIDPVRVPAGVGVSLGLSPRDPLPEDTVPGVVADSVVDGVVGVVARFS